MDFEGNQERVDEGSVREIDGLVVEMWGFV
jgi:hypothetical protein